MDDFQWLEDKPPQKHHQWLKDYWLHMIAVAVIAIVLLLLLFNPASKSTVPGASLRPTEPSNKVQMASAPTENVPKKQILIRMPDKSTKKVETTEDGTTQLAVPTTKTKPSTTLIKPATRLSANSNEATAVSTPTTPSNETMNQAMSEEEVSEVPTLTPKSTSSIASIGNLSTPLTTVPPVNSQAETVTEKPMPIASKPVVEPITEKPAPSIAVAPTTPKKVPPVEKTAPLVSKAPKAPAAVVSQGDSALYTMLKRPASHYVIQLFGSDNEASVKSFIAKNNLSKNALYVTVWHNNQNWFIVLYGDYADRNQAQAAVQELPTAISSNSPWPRSVQSVQEAIRQRLVREGMN